MYNYYNNELLYILKTDTRKPNLISTINSEGHCTKFVEGKIIKKERK